MYFNQKNSKCAWVLTVLYRDELEPACVITSVLSVTEMYMEETAYVNALCALSVSI